MSDVVERIDSWLQDAEWIDADKTLCDARDEIVALRAMLKRQTEAACEAVKMMGKYAQKSGWLLGGLEAVAHGLATADKVLAATKEKFPDGPA